ncbi:MAG: hypothetical protein HY680_07285 [Chloroflexi bacterium]|nr:hypothetical protein [Chloroflexota bacterium]
MEKRPSNLLDLLGTFRILPGEQEIEDILQRVQELKSHRPEWTNSQVARWYIRYRARLAGAAGAVAALPAAFPGIGTAAQIVISGVTFTPEMWFLLRQMAHLHNEVAAAFDQDLHSEDRRTELLLAFGIVTGAVLPGRETVKRIGTKVVINQFDGHVSGRWFQLLNRKLGTTVLTKFGTKRGGVAVGRLLPFGVGVGINAAFNYWAIRQLGRSSLRLYEKMLPHGGDLLVTAKKDQEG